MTDNPTYHFLFFGLTSFTSLPQREQAMAMECARLGHAVDFIEIPPSTAGRTHELMHRMFSPLSRDRGFTLGDRIPGLTIHTPPMLPTGFRSSLTPVVDRGMFRRWFRRRFAEMDFSRTIAMVMLPLWWGSLVDHKLVDPLLLVYDVCDALEVQARNRRALQRLRAHERAIAGEADLVTYSAHEMEEEIGRHFSNTETMFLPNAVSQSFIEAANNADIQKGSGKRRRVIGYVGVTDEKWFDVELFFATARRFPDCEIVVAGPVQRSFADRSAAFENVTLHGYVPHDRLPQLLRTFDAAIIPFLNNDITRVVNPLKLYEYTAAGLPVIAAGVEELRHYGEVAYLAQNTDDFFNAIARAFSETNGTSRAVRERFSSVNTWDARVRQLIERINDHAAVSCP